MELSLPAKPDPKEKPSKVKNGLTFLLTKDHKIFYYVGEFSEAGNEEGKPPTELLQTSFSQNDLHKLLLEKNSWAIEKKKQLIEEAKQKKWADSTLNRNIGIETSKTEAVTVLIKTDAEATYEDVINMLDELKVCDVGKRVLGVEMMSKEYELLQQKIK